MKKIIYCLTVAVIFTFLSVTVSAATVNKNNIVKEPVLTEAQKEARVEQITQRVEEIRAMDKSKLSHEQRKELRKELKEMKNEARAITSGGVYLSVGAIIIIILVLLLIL